MRDYRAIAMQLAQRVLDLTARVKQLEPMRDTPPHQLPVPRLIRVGPERPRHSSESFTHAIVEEDSDSQLRLISLGALSVGRLRDRLRAHPSSLPPGIAADEAVLWLTDLYDELRADRDAHDLFCDRLLVEEEMAREGIFFDMRAGRVPSSAVWYQIVGSLRLRNDTHQMLDRLYRHALRMQSGESEMVS